MGVSNREQEIIDRHEAGRSVEAIAKELDLGVDYVRYRIADLCLNTGPNGQHERAMRAGSRALLKAIQQARAG